jgi:hypothetical protein
MKKQLRVVLCVAVALGLADLTTQLIAQDTVKASVAETDFDVPEPSDQQSTLTKGTIEVDADRTNSSPTDSVKGEKSAGRRRATLGAPQALLMSESRPSRKRVVTRYVQEIVQEPIPEEEIAESTLFEQLLQELKSETDDEVKTKLSMQVKQLLEKQYERDLNRREQELAPVEARVKALRQQLDKRKASMKEIIDLRFKTIINTIDGLGFPDEEGRFGLPHAGVSAREASDPVPVDVVEPAGPKKAGAVKPRSRTTEKKSKPTKTNPVEPAEDPVDRS